LKGCFTVKVLDKTNPLHNTPDKTGNCKNEPSNKQNKILGDFMDNERARNALLDVITLIDAR
jgi:hypothetical protein